MILDTYYVKQPPACLIVQILMLRIGLRSKALRSWIVSSLFRRSFGWTKMQEQMVDFPFQMNFISGGKRNWGIWFADNGAQRGFQGLYLKISPFWLGEDSNWNLNWTEGSWYRWKICCFFLYSWWEKLWPTTWDDNIQQSFVNNGIVYLYRLMPDFDGFCRWLHLWGTIRLDSSRSRGSKNLFVGEILH